MLRRSLSVTIRRIDDFCILSAGEGEIEIGKHVHIACYVSLIGKNKIKLDDFSGISSRVSIYSSSDDFSGMHLTGPTVDEQYTNVIHGDVHIKKHVVIGAGSVILPGVIVEEGSAVGALSLVNKNIPAFCIAGGVPAIFLKERSRKLISLEEEYLEEERKKEGIVDEE